MLVQGRRARDGALTKTWRPFSEHFWLMASPWRNLGSHLRTGRLDISLNSRWLPRGVYQQLPPCPALHSSVRPHRSHCFWGLVPCPAALPLSGALSCALPSLEPCPALRRPRLAASTGVSSHYLHSAWINLGRVAHNGGGLSPLCAGHRQSGPQRCAYYHRQ